MLRLNHVTKERDYFQEKQRSRRERERERENWEKLLSYARLRVPWINLGISPRQVAGRGWDQRSASIRSIHGRFEPRRHASLSLSIDFYNRSLAVEVGDTFMKKKGKKTKVGIPRQLPPVSYVSREKQQVLSWKYAPDAIPNGRPYFLREKSSRPWRH